MKLLVDLGTACSTFQDEALRNLTCERIQVDEIWSFVYAKAKNVPKKAKGCHPGIGDAWTWTAIDADTKLIVSYAVGGRDAGIATRFLKDVAARLKDRVQLTSDGYKAYLNAVESAFGDDIDYAQLIKLYGQDGNPNKPETKYSPGKCHGATRMTITGDPEKEHVSTSYVERNNLTMRMGMRRFTRLTNAFSKKAENLVHAVSLHFMHYNFCRPHMTLCKKYERTDMTPAMAASVTDHRWSLDELLALIE